MSYKVATYISLIVITILNGLYFLNAYALVGYDHGGATGPSDFPILLSVLLFAFCLASFINTIVADDGSKIKIPSIKKIVVATVLFVAFLTIWSQLQMFYIPAFVLSMLLFILNKPNLIHERHSLAKHALLVVVMLTMIYVVFDYMLLYDL